MDDEVKQGQYAEYQVYVRTGDRIGASSNAMIKITVYGKDGRTKEFPLKDSMRHKIKFQRGKEDKFVLGSHHVGKLQKVKIGHDRTDLGTVYYMCIIICRSNFDI